jgi:hypothetical protein
VDSVISVDSLNAGQIDSVHVCQLQLADMADMAEMAEMADNQPPVNDRPERD